MSEHDPTTHAIHRIGSFVERGAVGAIFANDVLHRIIRPNPLEVGPGEPALYTDRLTPRGCPAVAYHVDPTTGQITSIFDVAVLAPPVVGGAGTAPLAFAPPATSPAGDPSWQ